MAEWQGAGRSRYVGLRTTVTMHPGKPLLLASTSVKDERGGWNDWRALAPLRRVELAVPPASTEAALWLLHEITYASWLAEVNGGE